MCVEFFCRTSVCFCVKQKVSTWTQVGIAQVSSKAAVEDDTQTANPEGSTFSAATSIQLNRRAVMCSSEVSLNTPEDKSVQLSCVHTVQYSNWIQALFLPLCSAKLLQNELLKLHTHTKEKDKHTQAKTLTHIPAL